MNAPQQQHTAITPSTDVEEAYRTCQRITKEGAKNFYYAFLTLPKPKRQAIYAAYAFCRACDDVADDPDPQGARADQLAAIRANLRSTYCGNPDGPVFTALWDAASRYGIPQDYLEDVIKGVEMDLHKSRYQTFEELKAYCYYVASAVGLICIHVFEYEDPHAVEYAIDLGIAMQLTNILRDVAEDAANGRIYLPVEDLDRFGYTEGELLAGEMNDRFRSLMKFEADRARGYFASGAQLYPLLDKRSRACPQTLATVYRRILDKMEREGFPVFEKRAGLTKAAKLGVVARLWLRSRIPVL